MGISIERNNIVGLDVLGRTLMADLLANGFTEVSNQNTFSAVNVATFQAGATVDPLAATQPWRIRIAVDAGNTDGYLDFHVGTQTNLPDNLSVVGDGTISGSNIPFESTGHLEGIAGANISGFSANQTDLFTWHAHQIYNNPVQFVSNSGGQAATLQSRPMSYRLTISDRGIAFCAWCEGFEAEGDMWMWLVIQRPVDNATGAVLTTGRAPVFVLYSSTGGYPGGTSATDPDAAQIYAGVVREADVLRPYGLSKAGGHTVDHHAVLNPIQQVAIAENNQFVITFPNKFVTSRHVYKHEMDMIAYTSSDVISQFSNINVTVYGEGTQRTYTALNANLLNNTGMRILFLTANGGV